MFQTAEVEHAYTAVGPTRDEDVNAVGAEADVVDFFIVSDQLGFGREGGDVPYRTSRVDGGSDNQGWLDDVPIEGCYWCSVFW